MPRTQPLAVALVLALVMPSVSAAQADSTRADTTVFRIEGISIQTQRPVTRIGGASAIEVRVEALQLPPAPTAGELLREISGVHVRTNSRGQDEISVRGSESRQVAVLFDGVPLTLGYDARTDVSILPATALREVSFVRGLSTLLHGPNVLGGVVEMNVAKSVRMPTERSVTFSASLDHVGGYSTAANGTLPFSTTFGRGMVLFGAGYRDTPGFPLPHGVQEPSPQVNDLRLNTDFSNLDGYFGLRYATDAGAWGSVSATSHRADRGIAAELGAEDPRLWRYPNIRRTIVAASAGTGDRETPFGRGDLEMSVGYDDGVTDIRSYASRAYDEIIGYEDGNDRTLSLRLLGDHTLGRRGELRSSFTWAGVGHDETIDGEFREFEQRLVSLAAETAWRLVDTPGEGLSALRLSFGGAWDRGTTPRTGGLEPLPTLDDWGARVGLSALVAGGNTMLHAGASRRGRFPALREAYSEALNRFEPNPDLRPEHLVAVEAGITTRVGSGELQLVGFHHDLDGAIRRISLPDRKRKRVNADELLSRGVEVMFTQGIGEGEIGGEVTLQSVQLTDPGTGRNKNPENVPEQAASAFVRFPLGGGVSTRIEAEYTGRQWCIDPDSGEDVRLDGGSWLNAMISKVWSLGSRNGSFRRVETSLAGSNLGNNALYDSCGLPRSGRLLRFQIRVF